LSPKSTTALWRGRIIGGDVVPRKRKKVPTGVELVVDIIKIC
jgi:hypothetical protein